MSEDILTQKELKRLLDYDPNTGEFMWKVTRSWRAVAGQVAGTLRKSHAPSSPYGVTYICICVNGRNYSGHRLAWFWVHGKWPKNELDHINQNGLDNRIDNLLPATRGENARNMRMHKSNTSGTTGVHFAHGKWMAEIEYNKNRIYLGFFADKKDAIAARKQAEEDYGFSGNHGR